MPRKQTSAPAPVDDNFDEVVGDFQESKTMNKDYTLLFFTVALAVSVMPVQLFSSVYDLSLESFGIVYLPVTVLAAILLTKAYQSWTSTTYAALSNSRKMTGASAHKKLGISKQQFDYVQDQTTARESVVWSLFINNFLFVLCFLFIAEYALKGSKLSFSSIYSVAVVASSAAVWQLSTKSGEDA